MDNGLGVRAGSREPDPQAVPAGPASIPSANEIIERLKRLSGLNHAEDHWDYEELTETVAAAVAYIQEHP